MQETRLLRPTLAESCFASLECELLDRTTFKTHAEARMALSNYIVAFYHRKRRHSALGQVSPDDFDRAARLRDEA